MAYRRGSLQIPPEPERDRLLDRLAEQSGYKSSNALLATVARIISRCPPRRCFSLLASIEAAVDALKKEETAKR